MEQRYERDDQKIDWLESENRRLRAELETAKRREVSPEFLHKLDTALLQLSAMTQERDNERQIAVDWETKAHAANRLNERLQIIVDAAADYFQKHYIEGGYVGSNVPTVERLARALEAVAVKRKDEDKLCERCGETKPDVIPTCYSCYIDV